ncbi:MAG: tetratricopeptide repeat protein, partial [Lysobacterales bacterium]
DTLVPALHLPDWFHSGVAFLLILGFPVAIIFAWAFELTPEGLKKEKDVDRSESITHITSRKLDFVVIGLLVVALGYFAYDKFVLDPKRDTVMLESAARPSTEIVAQLEQAETPPEAAYQSIAVLSFVNMSDDASNEYFSEGLSEELLNLLVKIPELRVAARTSSFSYKGTGTKIAQIGQELNVTHVLEGSVRKSGNQIRITAQLVKADDGFHLWSQSYDRTLDNIFQIQDEIAAAVVDGLKITLLGAIPESRNTDPEVYSLYLQGKYFNNLRGEENLEKAVLAFKQALAIDPDYAPAWVGISWAYELQTRFRFETQAQGVALAREAAERALAIDDNMALAWSTIAFLKKTYEWDWQGAKAAIDKALQLEPNNADVIGAAASLASTLGQLAKSIELFERTVALDPLGLAGLIALGNRYSAGGRYDEALEKYNQVLALNPEYPRVRLYIVRNYLRQGNPERALAEIDKLSVNLEYRQSIKATVLFTLGEEMESQAITNEILETSAEEYPLQMAIIYAWRGENDSAFEWLEAAFEQRDGRLHNILWIDALARLESDPRYPVFLDKLGLLEAWKAMPPE